MSVGHRQVDLFGIYRADRRIMSEEPDAAHVPGPREQPSFVLCAIKRRVDDRGSVDDLGLTGKTPPQVP